MLLMMRHPCSVSGSKMNPKASDLQLRVCWKRHAFCSGLGHRPLTEPKQEATSPLRREKHLLSMQRCSKGEDVDAKFSNAMRIIKILAPGVLPLSCMLWAWETQVLAPWFNLGHMGPQGDVPYLQLSGLWGTGLSWTQRHQSREGTLGMKLQALTSPSHVIQHLALP